MIRKYVLFAPLCCMLIPALTITSGCNQPAAAPAKTEGLTPVPPRPQLEPNTLVEVHPPIPVNAPAPENNSDSKIESATGSADAPQSPQTELVTNDTATPAAPQDAISAAEENILPNGNFDNSTGDQLHMWMGQPIGKSRVDNDIKVDGKQSLLIENPC